MTRFYVTFPGAKLDPGFPGKLITEGDLLTKLLTVRDATDLSVIILEPAQFLFLTDARDILELEPVLLGGVPGVEPSPAILHLFDVYEMEEYADIMKSVAITKATGTLAFKMGGKKVDLTPQKKEGRPYDDELETSDSDTV